MSHDLYSKGKGEDKEKCTMLMEVCYLEHYEAAAVADVVEVEPAEEEHNLQRNRYVELV